MKNLLQKFTFFVLADLILATKTQKPELALTQVSAQHLITVMEGVLTPC
jgi:hypothetical protein